MEILRTEFVDRLFSASDLAQLVDMLRRWFLTVALDAEQSAEFQAGAWIFPVPQRRRSELIRTLSARVPHATFNNDDPDHIAADDPAETVDFPSQLMLWRELLAAPETQQTCLILRMTFRGFIKNLRNHPERSVTTIVLCGAPADGGLLLKAMWQEGLDQGMLMAHRFAAWAHERRLLEAFDLFLQESAADSRDEAARYADEYFRQNGEKLFLARSDERSIMRLVRLQVETMDERGPAAFARRLGIPLLASLAFLAIAVYCVPFFPSLVFPCYVAALLAFVFATRIAAMKIGRVYAYFKRMRKSLGAVHSAPIEYQEIDLSTEGNPTLLKYTTEAQDLGARHLCDLSFKSALNSGHRARHYITNDSIIAIGLLHKTETHFFFPARPMILLSTRFKDGRQHFTSNTPEYRKLRRANITRRCVIDAAGAEEILRAHRLRLDKLVAAGAVLVPPPTSARALIDRLIENHNETRELWKKLPYSWGDAIHAAFKVCRRQYLAE